MYYQANLGSEFYSVFIFNPSRLVETSLKTYSINYAGILKHFPYGVVLC